MHNLKEAILKNQLCKWLLEQVRKETHSTYLLDTKHTHIMYFVCLCWILFFTLLHFVALFDSTLSIFFATPLVIQDLQNIKKISFDCACDQIAFQENGKVFPLFWNKQLVSSLFFFGLLTSYSFTFLFNFPTNTASDGNPPFSHFLSAHAHAQFSLPLLSASGWWLLVNSVLYSPHQFNSHCSSNSTMVLSVEGGHVGGDDCVCGCMCAYMH